ncbi:CPBP family intramembrane metalloprotease [Clostridium sp. NSJ-6]|uniref:CPBP family intramembrane metalloprotease n=2 Tax=Clostridium hominis TaxID=2763036 RepID=A0ABR7DHZ1_9CLOT|nr:CPBP family intramembrane metalloprotease [Clostridium hominis]
MMKLNYVKNLNNGSLEIKPITFWKALLLSFLFDITYSFVYTPISLFINFYRDIIFVNSWSENILNSITDFIYQYGVILIVIVVINKSFKTNGEILYREEISKKKYLAGIGLMIGYIFITYGVFDIFLYSMPTLNDGLYEYLEEYLLNTSYIFIFISTCIIAPIFEEILYRGVLLNGLLKKYNYKKAIIYSALIFGIAHMNLPQGVNAFFLGVIIGLAYYYTRSIYLCMAMHFINNFLVNFVVYPESKLWTAILFIIVPIIGILIFIKSFKVISYSKGISNGQEDY